MILTRTPLRISFGGGGTDLAAYYARHGGLVVSTAIDKYVYAGLEPNPEGSIEIASCNYGASGTFEEIDQIPGEPAFRLVAAALRYFRLSRGRFFLAGEVAPGTGLGSSCAVTVGLTKAITAHLGWIPERRELAEMAFTIDTEIAKFPIGKQDQYASVYGGLNAISFGCDTVDVRPVEISKRTRAELEERTLLFSAGKVHDSSKLLREQEKKTQTEPSLVKALHDIKKLAKAIMEALEDGDLDEFGALLDESWRVKRSLTDSVSSHAINRAYSAAKGAGAIGGKIAGAGGGGFLLLHAPSERHEAIRTALGVLGWKRMRVHFDNEGARFLIGGGRGASARMPWERRAEGKGPACEQFGAQVPR